MLIVLSSLPFTKGYSYRKAFYAREILKIILIILSNSNFRKLVTSQNKINESNISLHKRILQFFITDNLYLMKTRKIPWRLSKALASSLIVKFLKNSKIFAKVRLRNHIQQKEYGKYDKILY